MMLKLKPGIYRIDRPIELGSMRLVGARNFHVPSALAALYHHVHNLFVFNILKKNRPARRAEVIYISASFEHWPSK
jgi:hypothetical protein